MHVGKKSHVNMQHLFLMGSWRRWLAVKLFGPIGDLAVVVVQSLGPKGFPLALLKATRIDAEMPRLAAA